MLYFLNKFNKKLHIAQKQNTQITKHPRLQNFQIYKMSKVTKYPKLQKAQIYKMFKVTKYPMLQTQINKMSKITKCPKFLKCLKKQNIQSYIFFGSFVPITYSFDLLAEALGQ